MGEIRGKIDKDAQPFPVKLPFRVRDFIYGGAEDAGMVVPRTPAWSYCPPT